MVSRQPRKQRARLHSLPLHIRHKFLAATLRKDLREKYNVRSLPVRKGDRVKIMRGDFKRLEGDVLKVHTKEQSITVQGASVTKADGSQVQRPIKPSNVMLIRLVEDKERLRTVEGGPSVG